MTHPVGGPVPVIVDGLFRRSASRITAILARVLGPERLDLAEEAVQDALLRALQTWPHRGVPQNPEGWLSRVARNRALDLLRREAAHDRATAALLEQGEPEADAAGDDEVRLLLLCLHPALTPRARVALALKTVGGLGVNEIARGLLCEAAAAAQLLVRARRLVQKEGLVLEMPVGNDLAARLESALDTIYLIFNEGYSASSGERVVREDLCAAAIGFAGLLTANAATDRPEVHALLALMCFQASRLAARADAAGDLLLLDRQDRALWDRGLIARGFAHLDRSAAGTRVTAWHLEAAIASCHAQAPSVEATRWDRVLELYDELLTVRPSPVAALSRVVAIERVHGAAAALRALDEARKHTALARYPLLPAVEAHLLRRAGDAPAAAAALEVAIERARTEPERRLLEGRREPGSPKAGSPEARGPEGQGSRRGVAPP